MSATLKGPWVMLALASALLLGPTAPALAIEGDAKGKALVQEFLAAYSRTFSFHGIAQVYTRKASQESHMRVDLAFQKPHMLAVTVLEHPENRLQEKTTITWQGERDCKVKTGFFGGLVRLTLPITDSRLRDIRGDTLKDVSIVTAIPMITHPRARTRYLGAHTLMGQATQGFEIKSPILLAGVVREEIYVSDLTKFPVVRRMFDADNNKVYELAFVQNQLNLTLPPTQFQAF